MYHDPQVLFDLKCVPCGPAISSCQYASGPCHSAPWQQFPNAYTRPSKLAGAAGGSGIVILSIPTSYYSGTSTGSPTVAVSGSNTILTFTASGSYTA